MKRFFAMLLAVLSMLLLASCGGTVEVTGTGTETSTTKTDEPFVAPDEVGNGNRVMIFIMGNKRTPEYSGEFGRWNQKANVEHNPDNAYADGRRDIASVYYPSVGLYDNSDPDYADYMMQLYKMCYIDAIDFYIVPGNEWQVDTFNNVTLEKLKKYGISATPRFQPADDAFISQNGEETVAEKYLAMMSDVALEIDGKQVLSTFKTDLDQENLQKWLANYEDVYGKKLFFIRPLPTGNLGDRWWSMTDGMYSWMEHEGALKGIRYATDVDPFSNYVTAENAKLNHNTTVAHAETLIDIGKLKYYIESLNPGFDDRGCWGWQAVPRYVDRGKDGEVYEYKWQAAVSHQFPMVCIPTWDDWCEGTVIEPTLEFGTLYMEMTRKYAAEYKGIVANTASLELPGWIYKIRKTTKDPAILAAMDEASDLIAASNYDAAEALVKPYVATTGIPATSTEFFNYPTSKTTLITPPVIAKDGKTPEKNADGSETFVPVADTYLKKSAKVTYDLGQEEKLIVKSADSTNLTRELFIRFDLAQSGIKDIKEAKLRLYCTYASTDPAEISGRQLKLYAADNKWKEQGFSWDNKPASLGLISPVDSEIWKKNTWVEIDVTDYVKAHPGEEITFMMANEGADTKNNHIEMSSREANGQQPQLVIK